MVEGLTVTMAHELFPSQSERLDIGAGEASADDDICGAEMTDGSTCERDPAECPYHG